MAFVPRASFPISESLPRSYFLGHHRAGLARMKLMLSQIDLVIECRDYRVPLSSRNPMFEEQLVGKKRLVVFTKRDLGSEGLAADRGREALIKKLQGSIQCIFSDHQDKTSVRQILSYAKQQSDLLDRLTGARMMVVGMPNVGKSSLLNALRHLGMGLGKAASTGAQPGVTRKIGTTVKILDGASDGEGIYLVDTPGVFVPYVPDAEAMLKLALCGNIKDNIVPMVTLADYLLYRLNRYDPTVYAKYCAPTNDATAWLGHVAHSCGRLKTGGVPDIENAANWMIQQWRNARLGRFVLDNVLSDSLHVHDSSMFGLSISQARVKDRQLRLAQAKSHRGFLR